MIQLLNLELSFIISLFNSGSTFSSNFRIVLHLTPNILLPTYKYSIFFVALFHTLCAVVDFELCGASQLNLIVNLLIT